VVVRVKLLHLLEAPVVQVVEPVAKTDLGQVEQLFPDREVMAVLVAVPVV
jgi:hypothetical protein